MFKVRRSLRTLFGIVLSVAFLFFVTAAIVFIGPEGTAIDYGRAALVGAVLLTGAAFCFKKPKG